MKEESIVFDIKNESLELHNNNDFIGSTVFLNNYES